MGAMARGRPRQFDEHDVLTKAAQVFRERGYDGTSMQALSQAMNMGEQSIYNAFGSKEQVFQRALEQYCSESEAGMRALVAPNAGRAGIEKFFSALIDKLVGEPSCLVTQTCLQMDEVGEVAGKQASRHMRNVERHLQRALEQAMAEGSVSCDDPKQLARYLNMSMQGMSVLAQSGTPKKQLRELANIALQALD